MICIIRALGVLFHEVDKGGFYVVGRPLFVDNHMIIAGGEV